MPGTYTAPWTWSSTSQLSSASPGPMLPRVWREDAAFSGLGRKVQRAGSTWPRGSCQSLQPHFLPEASRPCEQSGKGLAQESSREPVVGCRRPSMEADVHKQQPGWSVTESRMIQKRVRNEVDPESPPGLGSAGEEQQLVPRGGEPSGLSTGRRAGARDRCSGPVVSDIKERGTHLCVGSQHPQGSGPCSPGTRPMTLVKSPLFSRPRFPFQVNEGVGETAKRPSS